MPSAAAELTGKRRSASALCQSDGMNLPLLMPRPSSMAGQRPQPNSF